MSFFQFTKTQKIPSTIDEIWSFISDPSNLKKITPDDMNFEILSDNKKDKMYEGMIIEYKVNPVKNISTKWVTEITHVKDKQFFIDEQRVGPYKMWHHQHFIQEIEGGVLMKDIVSYVPPLGFIGGIANQFFIKNKLNQIFDYRKEALIRIYGYYDS